MFILYIRCVRSEQDSSADHHSIEQPAQQITD